MAADGQGSEAIGWLDDETWKLVQNSVPIACVDIVPVQKIGSDTFIGLIQRSSPFAGQLRWCQLGGRINIGETVRQAINRHLTETLTDTTAAVPDDPQPDYVMQWFPDPASAEQNGTAYGTDPRKHAIALTFVLELSGRPEPIPGSEARRFAWHRPEEIQGLTAELWPGTAALLGALSLLPH